MSEKPQIVLASGSPRRKQMLENLGIEFTVIPSSAAEDEIPDETPEDHVVRLSIDKAKEVAERPDVPGRWFIGSDTIVLQEGRILGKPAGKEDAAAMLRSLSGSEHRVLSGYAIIDREQQEIVADAVSTMVRFRELTESEIAGYIASGEPMDKAGAYAIQGKGGVFVESIEGSYNNVVGMPLCQVIEVLKRMGAVRLFE
ncbi:MAG: septum formation inhibitor Maf [Desulfuromonas sp.]|nr:MAG: septum formation inhibitor Maf [Desulfuromonas sp.]